MVKLKTFFKRYGYYCLAMIVIIALGVTIAVSVTPGTGNGNINSAKNPVVSVDAAPTVLTFVAPMENASVVRDFSEAEVSWNKTFSWFDFHTGVDISSDSSKVFAVADGKVLSVTEDTFEGTKIVIEHADGLQSVYGSLDKDVLVKAGDTITKGTQIGVASTTAGNESGSGAHLHFEMLKNGKKVDPNNYLELGNK